MISWFFMEILMCSGTESNDPLCQKHPNSLLSTLNMSIATMLNIVVIALVTIAIFHWHNFCVDQTRQRPPQQLGLSSKPSKISLFVVFHVTSSAITTLINWGNESIIKILYRRKLINETWYLCFFNIYYPSSMIFLDAVYVNLIRLLVRSNNTLMNWSPQYGTPKTQKYPE